MMFRGARKALRYKREPRAGQVMQAHVHPHSVYPSLPFLRLREVSLVKVGSDHPEGVLVPSSRHAQVGSETDISGSL